ARGGRGRGSPQGGSGGAAAGCAAAWCDPGGAAGGVAEGRRGGGGRPPARRRARRARERGGGGTDVGAGSGRTRDRAHRRYAMTEPDRPLGAHVSLLGSPRGGKYPEGRPLLVTGSEERAIIDPSLVLIDRAAGAPPADRVLNSHCHEDHVAVTHLYPAPSWLLPD